MTEIFYCDNYEELTGRSRDGSIRDDAETKVVSATDDDVVAKAESEPAVEEPAPADPIESAVQ